MRSILTNRYLVTATERFGLLAVKIASIVILSRYISPSDFGIYSITIAIVAFSTLLVDSGMGGALIREKSPSDDDYSTVFTSNLILSSMIFLVLLAASGVIGEIYSESRISLAISLASITILIKSLTITHIVKMTRCLDFSGQAKINLLSATLAFICSIGLAKNGFGLWSLIYQQVIESALCAIGFIAVNGSLPKIGFKKDSFRRLFSFGFNLTLSSLVKSAYENLSILILAKTFSITVIGYFGQANRINSMLTTFVVGVVDKSSYGMMSSYFHEDKNIFIDFCNRIFEITTLIGLIATYVIYLWSDELINIALGETWSESAWMLKILSISGFAIIMDSVLRMIIKASGNSSAILISEIIKKAIALIFIIVLISIGMEYVLYGISIASIIALGIGSYYAQQKAGFGILDQIKAASMPVASIIATHIAFMSYSEYVKTELVHEYIMAAVFICCFYFICYFGIKKLLMGRVL